MNKKYPALHPRRHQTARRIPPKPAVEHKHRQRGQQHQIPQHRKQLCRVKLDHDVHRVIDHHAHRDHIVEQEPGGSLEDAVREGVKGQHAV